MKIEVGDRVTYIEIKTIIDGCNPFLGDLKTKEVKNKVVEIVTRSDKEYKDILKIERIGSNGWHTVYEKKAEILDEKEKEYLKNVIKPFKNKIKYIMKTHQCFSDIEYLRIVLKEDNIGALPDFKQGTMYKNMKLEKEYTLKDLGLEE